MPRDMQRWLLIILPLLIGACHTPPAPFPKEAEVLCLNQRWDDAIPILRHHLLQNPDDAAGHFYLGECYLHRQDPSFAIAEGETRTALSLFKNQGGKKSPIRRFSATYFDLRCHLNLAKIPLRQVSLMIENRVPPKFFAPFIQRCHQELDAARAIVPDSADVRQLEQLVQELETSTEKQSAPANENNPRLAV